MRSEIAKRILDKTPKELKSRVNLYTDWTVKLDQFKRIIGRKKL